MLDKVVVTIISALIAGYCLIGILTTENKQEIFFKLIIMVACLLMVIKAGMDDGKLHEGDLYVGEDGKVRRYGGK